jgi:mannosyl-oligosaccharide alpha-1,2-mannosidase
MFAEVLKYTYLTFSSGKLSLSEGSSTERLTVADEEWQVQRGNGNKFVYNTEAHPIRVVA